MVINCNTKEFTLKDVPFLAKNIKEKEIDIDLVPESLKQRSLKEIISYIEQDILQKALDKYGSLTKVAEIYGLDRTTVSRKLKRI